ncbi:hypothetical protein CUS_5263 [Ruminococcus albus 8]|uniref:Uncharacterized protein n=1 Tax=Ruminococcus albus 8 TaxID=246199 RepID=E9SFJ7_RUMAL|nr:hypothetical protein CUS_5263 [Ruminococcus albus 8]
MDEIFVITIFCKQYNLFVQKTVYCELTNICCNEKGSVIYYICKGTCPI